MKNAASLLLIALLFCLTGCLPVSQNPLSDPEKAVADPRLAGVWYAKSGEDSIFLHFVSGTSARMDIAEVDHGKDGNAHTTLYTMFPTVIDGVRYMNIQEKKSQNKSYYLARYQVSQSGALTIWLMSEKAATKAVGDEKISGKVEEKKSVNGKPDHDVTLTASTEQLAAFVKKSDPETLFAEKFGTFKRVTLPTLDASPSPSPSPAAKKAAGTKTGSKTGAKKKKSGE